MLRLVAHEGERRTTSSTVFKHRHLIDVHTIERGDDWAIWFIQVPNKPTETTIFTHDDADLLELSLALSMFEPEFYERSPHGNSDWIQIDP